MTSPRNDYLISSESATDPNRPDYYWLTDDSRTFLQRGYINNGVSAEQRIREIAENAERILKMEGFADKFEYCMKRGWFSLSSPVWSNFGTKKGLPIACFGSYIPDSTNGILEAVTEVGMMTKYGGGTSGYFGHIRPRGSIIVNNGKSDGTFNFAKLFDATINVISQGSSRRGMFAGYIDADHGDIMEWLDIKTEGNPIQDMFYGVCISSQWLKEMQDGDAHKRNVWKKILKSRSETGIPYILFTDNVNNARPDVYRDKNLEVLASNLCAEIALPSNKELSFVCCLSSMNLFHYDEWKDTDAPKILTYFLDAVMEEFVQKTESNTHHMERAHKFAKEHRALGIGVLGWHSYLQANMIPFESQEAFNKTQEIFGLLQTKTLEASKELAEIFGEPEILKGYGRRNTCLMAIAPTKSSSSILGNVSPSIEPIKSNYFVKELAKIKVSYRNPFFAELLKTKGKDTEEVWESILLHDGSCQHLDFLSEQEKAVFKTFEEISPELVIRQAALRQQYVDQSQSLNIFIGPEVEAKEIHRLHMLAHDIGVKSLYYQQSVNASQQFNRNLRKSAAPSVQATLNPEETCSTCEA